MHGHKRGSKSTRCRGNGAVRARPGARPTRRQCRIEARRHGISDSSAGVEEKGGEEQRLDDEEIGFRRKKACGDVSCELDKIDSSRSRWVQPSMLEPNKARQE
jgi:hypothetical protein